MTETSDPAGSPPAAAGFEGDDREGQARIWAGALLVVYGVACLVALVIRGTLGHDESVYALRADDLEDGWGHLSGGYWSDYRAPGLPLLIAAAQLAAPSAPTVARAVVVVLGAVVLAATWHLARTVHGAIAAVVAVGALIVTTGFLLSSTMVLADIPGMAFTLIAVVVFHDELRRRRLRTSLLAVPALAFAATLCRFGAPFALAGGLGAVGVVAIPSLIRERRFDQVLRMGITAVATAAVCGVVLFTTAFTLGGASPVESNSRLIEGKQLTPATGLSDLRVVLDPWGPGTNLWGRPTAVVMAIGLLAALGAAMRTPRARPALLAASLAGIVSLVGVVASVGLVVPNYLMLTLPYWAIVVGIGWSWLLSEVGRLGSAPWLAPAALGLVFAVALPGVVQDVRAGHRNNSASYGRLASVSTEVGEELGEGCLIVTSYTPQVGYYSGCWVYPIGHQPGEDLAQPLRRTLDIAVGDGWDGAADQVALLTVYLGKRQPPPEVISESVGIIARRLMDVGHTGGRQQQVWVDLLEPCFVTDGCG